jgi:hypothetical protein
MIQVAVRNHEDIWSGSRRGQHDMKSSVRLKNMHYKLVALLFQLTP